MHTLSVCQQLTIHVDKELLWHDSPLKDWGRSCSGGQRCHLWLAGWLEAHPDWFQEWQGQGLKGSFLT